MPVAASGRKPRNRRRSRRNSSPCNVQTPSTARQLKPLQRTLPQLPAQLFSSLEDPHAADSEARPWQEASAGTRYRPLDLSLCEVRPTQDGLLKVRTWVSAPRLSRHLPASRTTSGASPSHIGRSERQAHRPFQRPPIDDQTATARSSGLMTSSSPPPLRSLREIVPPPTINHKAARAGFLQSPSLDVAQSAALTACAAIGRTHLGRGGHDRKVSGLSAPFDHKPHSPMPSSFGAAGSAVTPPTAVRASSRGRT